jgi:hypothetical protein
LLLLPLLLLLLHLSDKGGAVRALVVYRAPAVSSAPFL